MKRTVRSICIINFLLCISTVMILFASYYISTGPSLMRNYFNSNLFDFSAKKYSVKHNSIGSKYCITYKPTTGRLGNQMFSYSSTLGMSVTTNMTFVFPSGKGKYLKHLTSVFKLETPNLHSLQFCKGAKYLDLIENSKGQKFLHNFMNLKNKSVRVHGYLQSYQYFDHIHTRVKNAFTFIDSIKQSATKFHQRIINSLLNPSNYSEIYTKVGIHVRMGDYRRYNPNGVRLAPKEFYIKAAEAFLRNYSRIVFIVSTQLEEEHNVRKMFESFEKEHPNAKIGFAPLQSAGEDMAILASCDHLIMSVGSYGWWAGWLTGGTVIYYDNWIKNGSEYAKRLESEASFQYHYPLSWIPLH